MYYIHIPATGNLDYSDNKRQDAVKMRYSAAADACRELEIFIIPSGGGPARGTRSPTWPGVNVNGEHLACDPNPAGAIAEVTAQGHECPSQRYHEATTANSGTYRLKVA